jgi:hypothetical protein
VTDESDLDDLLDAAGESSDSPWRICALCPDVLGVSGVGISVVTEAGNRGVVCATDDLSSHVEQLQFTLGEGPCVEAIASGAPVLVPDLADGEGSARSRWPAFTDAAVTSGVAALFAIPLRVGGVRLGAMDFYRSTPGPLSPRELAGAVRAADAAASALLRWHTAGLDILAEGAAGAYQLQVHQATGMVKVQLGVSIEEALVRLRARAFATATPLQDLANDIIARRTRFSLEDR